MDTTNDTQEVKTALKAVLKRYTFFELETSIVEDLEGQNGTIEKLIIDHYTDAVPTVLRKVS